MSPPPKTIVIGDRMIVSTSPRCASTVRDATRLARRSHRSASSRRRCARRGASRLRIAQHGLDRCWSPRPSAPVEAAAAAAAVRAAAVKAAAVRLRLTLNAFSSWRMRRGVGGVGCMRLGAATSKLRPPVACRSAQTCRAISSSQSRLAQIAPPRRARDARTRRGAAGKSVPYAFDLRVLADRLVELDNHSPIRQRRPKSRRASLVCGDERLRRRCPGRASPRPGSRAAATRRPGGPAARARLWRPRRALRLSSAPCRGRGGCEPCGGSEGAGRRRRGRVRRAWSLAAAGVAERDPLLRDLSWPQVGRRRTGPRAPSAAPSNLHLRLHLRLHLPSISASIRLHLRLDGLRCRPRLPDAPCGGRSCAPAPFARGAPAHPSVRVRSAPRRV